MVFIDSHADRGEGEEKRPRAMSLSVKAMVATAASHPKMWGRQKMWGRRPFEPKCGDVKRDPEKVGTSPGCGDVVFFENVGTSPGFRRRAHIFGRELQRNTSREGGGSRG